MRPAEIRRATMRAAGVLAMVLAGVSVGRGADEPFLSMAQLTALYDAGKYADCHQQIGRLIGVKGAVAKGYDRYKLLSLEGDCLLQMKDVPRAKLAYAGAKESEDVTVGARARAMELLLTAAPRLVYQPRTPRDAAAIDILDSYNRRKAMAALFADTFEEHKKELALATAARTLGPMLDVTYIAADLYALEITATDRVTHIGAEISKIAKRSEGLIIQELARIRARTKMLLDLSQEQDEDGNYRGITGAERDELKRTAAYVTRIELLSRTIARNAKQVEPLGPEWDDIAEGIALAAKELTAILRTN